MVITLIVNFYNVSEQNISIKILKLTDFETRKKLKNKVQCV